MKTVIGIIGCGTIANSAHIPSYMNNHDVEIKYFCDIKSDRAAKAVETYGVGQAVTDYTDVLNDPEVDAVSVCTPNYAHAEITIAALEAGKHVLCEKPAARTYDEARQMQIAKHKNGKILSIGVVNRFNDGVNHIKDLVQSGALGDVYHVYVSFRAHRSIPGIGGDFTRKSIAGGGALIDWGVHYLDIVMYCLGDPQAKTVSAEVFSKLGADPKKYTYVNMWAEDSADFDGVYDVDDSMTALVRTEGPVFTVHGAWAQNIGEEDRYIDFMGDKGGIRLYYGADFTYYGAEEGKLVETKYSYPSHNMFQTEIDDFVRCIREGDENQATIDRNILTSQMMQAMYDSAEAHREVTLEPHNMEA